jgi:TPR repeat protein
MGLRYRNAWDQVLDSDLAESWFKKAAKTNHAGAIRELGKLAERTPWGMQEPPPKELKRAVDFYRQASDLGDAEATGNLALLHQLGQGTPKRPDVAENLYVRCLEIDPDYARAHNNLAIIYQDRLAGVVARGGGDAEALRTSMLKSLEASARLGLAVASVNLGRLYSSGDLVPQDYSKSYTYFDDAAAAGIPDAHFALGIMHEKGLGVPITYSEAAYHYRLAALDGHRQALDRLIDSYMAGRGVDVDWDMAAFWLLRAVEQGDTVSLIMFADVQLRRGNAKSAFDLFMKLWDHKSDTVAGFACDRLSLCYAAGLGVKASPAKAKKYFDLAIQKGNGDALARLAQTHFANQLHAEGVAAMTRGAENSAVASYQLGQMYFFGTYVEKDQAKAMELMRRASRRNHPKALYFLAAATFNRVPEAPEIEEAIRFAESAEKMGLPEAASLREKLERRRDQTPEETEQVARARSG